MHMDPHGYEKFHSVMERGVSRVADTLAAE